MKKLIQCIIALSALGMLSSTAQAQDFCLSISPFGDDIRLDVGIVSAGAVSIQGWENSNGDAIYGNLAFGGPMLALGLTKNTAAATVQIDCPIPGPGNVHVFFSVPFSSTNTSVSCDIIACPAFASSSSGPISGH